MKKQLVKRVMSCMIATIMFTACFAIPVFAEQKVKVSDTNYTVDMDGASNFYLYNKDTIGSEVGTEYYLTYTVESIDAEEFFQQGLLGSNNPSAMWPYEKSEQGGGLLKYNLGNELLVEGNTYFYKFVVTKDGYSYEVGYSNDKTGKNNYIDFEYEYGEVKTGLDHFGIWFADIGLTGKLIKVRCYDKFGNDLGVKVSPNSGAVVGREVPFPKDTKVEHHYKLTLDNVNNIAISNRRKPTGDKVYIEYKVESSDSLVWQNGVVLGNEPIADYPYLNGMMQYDFYEYDPKKVDDGPLLVEGAEYLIVFEKKDEYLDITIQQTLNGRVTYIDFPVMYGTYQQEGEFYSIWFGDGPKFPVNAVLSDFKFYDSNKNNLGVQTNVSSKIEHFGELEDYAGCESIYYCKDNGCLYALYADKSLKYTADKKTDNGVYHIEADVMTTTIGSQKKEYDYLYQYFTDEEEKVYERLQSCKVVFETGKGSAIETQVLNEDNGYMPMRPNNPTCEGNTFVGWYTIDGKEYKFDDIVTDSLTLYAKWEETDWIDTTVLDIEPYMPYIAIGVSILIMAGAVLGGFAILGRRKKSDCNKKD